MFRTIWLRFEDFQILAELVVVVLREVEDDARYTLSLSDRSSRVGSLVYLASVGSTA